MSAPEKPAVKALPSWMYDVRDPMWGGDWRLPDHAHDRLDDLADAIDAANHEPDGAAA